MTVICPEHSSILCYLVWCFKILCGFPVKHVINVLHALLCLKGIFICTLFGVSIATVLVSSPYLGGERGGCSSQERKPEYFLLHSVQL